MVVLLKHIILITTSNTSYDNVLDAFRLSSQMFKLKEKEATRFYMRPLIEYQDQMFYHTVLIVCL
jgi:hypothetical protein